MKKQRISLYIQRDYDGSQIYIGESFTDIGDNETGKEFKNRVKQEVNSILDNKIPEKDFKIYEEAWHDG